MKAWTVRVMAAGLLGVGLLTLAPAGNGVTAAEPVPAEAVVADHCLDVAILWFERCRERGRGVPRCLEFAAEKFNECMNDGGGEPNP